MNKFKLFPLALAAIAFSACTSEEVAENNSTTGEGTTSYVAVNINSVGTSGSRADGDYADGSANENKINAVRFYFFTENGEATIWAQPTMWRRKILLAKANLHLT